MGLTMAARAGVFFFQAEDGIRDIGVTGVQTCALPIYTLPTGVDVRRVYGTHVTRPESDDLPLLDEALVRLRRLWTASRAHVVDELGRRVEMSSVLVVEACARRSEEHTSELQSRQYLVCRLL